jgi:hypothetical protein
MYEGSFDSSHAHGTDAPACSPAKRLPVDIAAATLGIARIEPAMQDQHLLRRMLRQPDRLVDQRLVGNALAHAAAAVRRDISFGLASSIRAARLAAANPPKTTEWIAPIRAHARIAKHASGTIGM